MEQLISLGLDIDHYEGDTQNGISFYVNPSELEMLTTSDFTFEITIPDFNAYYKQQQLLDLEKSSNVTKSEFTANGFDFGSMGGYYTYDEIGAKLDEMRQDFPNLITAKTSIGLSYEGREIWMVKISDNPDSNEGELAAYFDSLHHAREPLSMATNINYMFWLLENYATNPQVQYLIDNRELYFVPVVNPDGYVYNEQTNPDGGGLWRKNRNVNSGGCMGVDLNRNYGFEFAQNGSCASNNECSAAYHGTGPFSEPETIAVRDLIALIQPKTSFSIHCYGGKFIMPYGNVTPPDFEIYAEWASSFLSENNYPYGSALEMVGYNACGTAIDYYYSEGVYSWTPELGLSGFWPPQSQIFDLVDENVYPMFYQSWIAGAYLDVQSHNQIGVALPGSSFELVVEVKNVGVGAASLNSEVVVQSSVSGVSVSPVVAYGDIAARTRQDNNSAPFVITVDPTFSDTSFNLIISTLQEGVENETSEIIINIGEKDVLFFDDSESGNLYWTASGVGVDWGAIDDDSYSGIGCLGDSNDGTYATFTQNYFELNEIFDLTSTSFPGISFMAKYSLGDGDLLRFQISTDSGTSWQNMTTFTLSERWKQQFVDLSDYTSENNVRFRFYLNNVNNSSSDGFYFDDFEVADYDSNLLDSINSENLSEVIITPNPFYDSFVIEGLISENSTVEMYDINGRKLRAEFIYNENTISFNQLETLAPGVYFLKIQNNKGSHIVKKMLKN
ncbi:M14 family zinc carboxypeptidase [Ulvibacter antarcticus]|nr:M14 family zinc carboxypeptidase [Ulvibacter antarcticus]